MILLQRRSEGAPIQLRRSLKPLLFTESTAVALENLVPIGLEQSQVVRFSLNWILHLPRNGKIRHKML